MTLKEYFDRTSGLCVLSSADGEGKVTTAVYSAPRVMEDGSVAFIMRERLTYRNLSENAHAACMFVAAGGAYRGLRLFLRKMREDNDPALIAKMTRRHLTPEEDRQKGPKHLVVFHVDKVLPLIGAGETGISSR
jgi:hypothetical protein